MANAAANPEQNEVARPKQFPETDWRLDNGGTQREKWNTVIPSVSWRVGRETKKKTKGD